MPPKSLLDLFYSMSIWENIENIYKGEAPSKPKSVHHIQISWAR